MEAWQLYMCFLVNETFCNKKSYLKCVLNYAYVEVQFYPCFKFSFLLFLVMVMYDNEFEAKEKKI